MRLACLALAAAAALASCGGGGEEELNDQQLAEKIENVAEVGPPDKSEAPGPALLAIRPEDRAGGFSAQGGCEFSEEGRVLLAARASGEALARVNGMAVRFAPSGPMGPSGGFFVTERYSISIGRLIETGVTVEGITAWPARLVLTDRRRREVEEVRLEGVWRCPAERATP
jgi:glucose/arabinose dehydrogenase